MKKRKLRKRWLAWCESCGRVGPIKPVPTTGEFHSPCPKCGCDTATYVLTVLSVGRRIVRRA